MKKKIFGFALLVTLIGSLSSCYVDGGHGYRHHHDHYYRGY